MSFNGMNFDDFILLKHARIDRMCSFFDPVLGKCYIYIGLQNTLNIYCKERWIFDTLMLDLEDLRNLAWLIMGTDAIGLFFDREEVYCQVCEKSKIRNFGRIEKTE